MAVLSIPIQFAPRAMVNHTTPAPFVVSSSSEFPTLESFYVFGVAGSPYWVGTGGGTDYVQIDLSAGNLRTLSSYSIRINSVNEPLRAPKDWTMLGSLDALSWDIVDTVTNQTAWLNGEIRSFTCDVSTTAYRYFRLSITANNGDATFTQIDKLYLQSAQTVDITIYRPTINTIIPGAPLGLGSITDPELAYDDDVSPPVTFAINERVAFSPLSDPYFLSFSGFPDAVGTPLSHVLSFWSSFITEPTYAPFARMNTYSSGVPIPFEIIHTAATYALREDTFLLSLAELPALSDLSLTTWLEGTLLGSGQSDFNIYDIYARAIYPISVECDNPPDGVVGEAYTHTFPVTGGDPAFFYYISAGILPTSLTFDPTTGVLSGTPTAADTFSFTVSVLDVNGETDSVACSVTVMAAPDLSISCNNPCEAVINVPYNHTFTAANGTEPYLYELTAGEFPTGLSLDFTTGILSGKPTVAALFAFTVSVTDADENTDSIDCTINVTDHVCPWHLCDLFTISEDCAMSGTVGLRRTADGVLGGSDSVSSNPITVEAGQVYFVEFFLRGSGGADGVISVGFDFYDVNNTYLSSGLVSSTGSPIVFTSFTGTVTVPVGAVTAVPVIKAVGHLTGVWCIAALFSTLMDQYFILSSIKHYFSEYTAYR